MAARKKRPNPRPQLTADAGANLVAWLILAIGLAVFVRVVYRHASEAAPPALVVATPVPVESEDDTAAPEPSPPPAATRPRATATAVPSLAPGPRDLLERQRGSERVPPTHRRRGRLAIIIDDMGQDMDTARTASRIPYPITFAIIPHLPHSRGAAKLLHAKGFELILHLPMEPKGYPREDPGAGAILRSMPDAEIRRTVRADLAAVPFIRGVNNHMGSRITSDPQRMRTVLETIAETSFFFIDSRTVEDSVALRIARELKIPSAERSVFLDDTIEHGAITAEIRRAFRIADERGSAIAIGHPHALTLSILLEQLPALATGGIEIVAVSDLVL